MAPKPSTAPLRVVSLLPSATENFCALLKYTKECRGLASPSQIVVPTGSGLPELVGRSHECDFPATADVQSLPVLTAPRTAFTTSADVHKQVREALADASSLYHLDASQLVALQPDVILTQSTCKVCSIDLTSVENVIDPLAAAKQATTCANAGENRGEIPEIPGKTTKIVTTNPISLVDVLVHQFRLLGHEIGLDDEGNAMAQQHLERIQALQALGRERRAANAALGTPVPRVMLVEWLDPLFIGKMGWMREIIEYASGEVVESLEISDGKPLQIDVVIVACCGLSLAKSEEEIVAGRVGDWWKDVVQANPCVYLVDGMSMFSRPTPKLLSALEWLVNLVHGGPDAEEYLQTTTFPYKKFDFAGAMKRVSESNVVATKRQQELADIEELHRIACENKQAMYTDPATGYSVMTAYNLQMKQVCCGNGCRHCPYGHVNVKDASRRTNKLTQTVVLQPKKRQRGTRAGGDLLWPTERRNAHLDTVDISKRDLIVLFWSGGKDSFLSLTTLYEQYAAQDQKPMPRVVLLTSVDPVTHTVPIQNIPHSKIVEQADALGLPVCIVGVGLGHAYAPQIHAALDELPSRLMDKSGKPHPIHSLVFGDLHLEDIRAWREETFGHKYTLQFPVWKKKYQTELLPLLRATCERIDAKVVFSNIESDVLKDHGICIGDTYDMTQLEMLKTEKDVDGTIDLMGECGEFHTCVVLPNMSVD